MGSYCKTKKKWQTRRRSKNEKKLVSYGHFKDEETAARASDTLARKLMENGEQNHKLNFPDENFIQEYQKETNSSKYTGVCYSDSNAGWTAQRWSKQEKKPLHNGTYKNEEQRHM